MNLKILAEIKNNHTLYYSIICIQLNLVLCVLGLLFVKETQITCRSTQLPLSLLSSKPWGTAHVTANAAPDIAFTPLLLPCIHPSLSEKCQLCVTMMRVDSMREQHCWSHLLHQPRAGLMFVGRARSGGVKRRRHGPDSTRKVPKTEDYSFQQDNNGCEVQLTVFMIQNSRRFIH